MIVWMFVVMSLSGFSGIRPGSALAPAPLGQGVTVTPVAGWESAKRVWDRGPTGISLQRAGVLVAFGADSFTGSAQQLLDDQLSGVRIQFGSFRSLPSASTTIAGGVPALKVLFSGTATNSGALEGELVIAATGSTAVVMLAVAPPGQVARAQGDLDAMLDSLVIPK
jgi:hypothetical protein